MSTIGDYLNEELSQYRLPLGETQLEALYLKNEVVPGDTLSTENMQVMDIALIGIIPKLLLSPDKQTGDTSLKWDRSSILAYYRLKCAEYGLPDDMYSENSINDSFTNSW